MIMIESRVERVTMEWRCDDEAMKFGESRMDRRALRRPRWGMRNI
jgi:hypothetical protein